LQLVISKSLQVAGGLQETAILQLVTGLMMGNSKAIRGRYPKIKHRVGNFGNAIPCWDAVLVSNTSAYGCSLKLIGGVAETFTLPYTASLRVRSSSSTVF
jgi:hypothetical protein